MKIMKSLEEAEILSKNEKLNNYNRDKLTDELELEKIDLDYNTIHSEILENIIISENDSGISDLDIDEQEKSKNNIFEIQKMKKIIQKSVKTFFNEFNENSQSQILSQNMENVNNNKLKEEKINVNEKNEKIEDTKSFDNFSTDVLIEKEKKIINFKKYNYLNDPNSNYNIFSKNYEIKKTGQKRYRDEHPFLKTFNTKFLKKENIDKKIIRKFRKFAVTFYNENKNAQIFRKNESFWKLFSSKNLLPPMKIQSKNGNIIEHKSFNSQFLIWMFNQEGMIEVFKKFIDKEMESIINHFILEYNLDKINDKNIIGNLEQYLKYIPEIYSPDKMISFGEDKEIYSFNYGNPIEKSNFKEVPFIDKNNLEFKNYEIQIIKNKKAYEEEKFH